MEEWRFCYAAPPFFEPYFYRFVYHFTFAEKDKMITVREGLSGSYFSCSIPDVSLSINGYRAAVVISIDDNEIYNEFLYPVGGVISVIDLSSLVTSYVKRTLRSSLKMCITEEFEDSKKSYRQELSADVIYCTADFGTSAAEFIESHFLSVLMGVKITALGRLEYLHYIGTDRASVIAYYSDGTNEIFTLVPVGGNDIYTTIDTSPSQFCVDGKSLAAYTVQAGGRTQEYQINFDMPDCAPILIFDNSFGVEELIYCSGTHTVSPSYKRESAYFGKTQKNYNTVETRTFKADTGILNFAMANWVDELFRSDFVRLVNFYKGHPNIGKEIVISESKSEFDNNDDTLPRFTFSYEYAQRNHNVVDMQRAGRIFDNTFDNTFN